MFKKIIKVSEKILLVLFFLAYFTYVALNIGKSRLPRDFEDPAMYIISSLAVLYAAVSPLRKISNVVVFLISITVIGVIICFLTPVVLLNFVEMNLSLIMLIYILVFIKSFWEIKRNVFLKLLIVSVSIITIVYFLLLQMIIVATSSPFNVFGIFYGFGYLLFSIATLFMIFGFPNSNFPDWSKEHRQIFLKLILSVWLFIFVISTMILFIPSERYKDTIVPELKEKWGMKDY